MDWTKKIVRKVAGQEWSTTAWATSISHKLISKSASEDRGLMKVEPPEILYVECCEDYTNIRSLGHGRSWRSRWICGTGFPLNAEPAHRLSTITDYSFVWDESDLQSLKAAKQVTCVPEKHVWCSTSPRQRCCFTAGGLFGKAGRWKSCSRHW